MTARMTARVTARVTARMTADEGGTMLDATSRRITTDDGVGLAVRVEGPQDGPVLLCCNSLGTDLRSWDQQAAVWARHRRVVRFDHRGHGDSDAPPGAYDIDRLGRDAVAVLDAVGVGQADVCGLSLGGLVGLWLGVHRPDRVRRLVLACTSSRIGTTEGWQDRARLVRDQGTAAIAPVVMERFFSAGFRSRRPDVVAAAEATLRATSSDGYAGCCLALAEADLTGRLHLVHATTLVIAGSEDVATPPAALRDLHEGLAQAQRSWLEIADAGHLANLEQPERFTGAVESFLAG